MKNEVVFVNWDDIVELVNITYKNEMNFGHAALSCELADNCKDYDQEEQA